MARRSGLPQWCVLDGERLRREDPHPSPLSQGDAIGLVTWPGLAVNPGRWPGWTWTGLGLRRLWVRVTLGSSIYGVDSNSKVIRVL